MALALPAAPAARKRVHRQRAAQREQVDQLGLGQTDQPAEPLALLLGQAGTPRLLRLLHRLPCPAGLEIVGHAASRANADNCGDTCNADASRG
jgi:hypothetical protein